MGWFEDLRERPLDTISDTARNVVQDVGNTTRSAMGSYGYLTPLGGTQVVADYFNQEDKKKQAEADAAEAQKRLDTSVSEADRLRSQQGLFAATLKKNALRDTGLLTNQAAANERRAMAEKLRDVKTSANSRGLIGSGFQKSGESGARAEAASNTASKEKQIQDLSLGAIQDAEDLQAQLGLEMGGIQQNMADQYYRMAVQNMQNRNQSYSDILTAGSRVGGTYLGNQQQQPNWYDVK